MSYSSKRNVPGMRLTRGMLLMGLTLLLTGGCANLGRHESDMPWNTPQSWEGVMPMPGMPGGGL